jgi:hypothetical protein
MDSDEKTLDLEIHFARHNFDNHQALIRSSDTKAGVNVTIMVFLAASALQLSRDAVGKLHLEPCFVATLSGLFVLASAGLLLSVIWSFVTVLRVLRPRGARYTRPQKDRDLMWQEHVLLHDSNEGYFSAVRGASAELILRNLTDQIYELAHISAEKMAALNKNRWATRLGFWSWVLVIASAFLLGRH